MEYKIRENDDETYQSSVQFRASRECHSVIASTIPCLTSSTDSTPSNVLLVHFLQRRVVICETTPSRELQELWNCPVQISI